jgi:hypothetical protein
LNFDHSLNLGLWRLDFVEDHLAPARSIIFQRKAAGNVLSLLGLAAVVKFACLIPN